MQKQYFIIVLILLVGVTALTGAAYFAGRVYHGADVEVREAVRLKEAEIDLKTAEAELIETKVKATARLAAIRQRARIAAAKPVEMSDIVLAVYWRILLPASTLGAVVGGLVYLKKRRVPFKCNGIETYVAQHEAAQLADQAMQMLGNAEGVKALTFGEDVTNSRLQTIATVYKSMRGSLGKVTVNELPAAPPQVAIPAFTGVVYLSQCRQDGDYEEGSVCWGRNTDMGGLVQLPLEVMQSLVKIGLQGQGKTVASLLEVWSAFYRKYVKGDAVRVYLIDKHAGFAESFSSRIEAMLPNGLSLFDECVTGADIADNGRLQAFLARQIDEGKQRQEEGNKTAPLDVIIFDEYTETVSTGKQGKEIEEQIKTLFNYRKAHKYLSLVLFEGVKNKHSVKGLSVAKMGISKMLFATDSDEAGRFLGWQHAPLAEGLKKGQCLLKLANEKSVVKIQLAQVEDLDFALFAKYVTAADDVTAVTADELGQGEELPRTPSQVIAAFLAAQKQGNANYSQADFARAVDVNKGLVSRALKDDPTVSKTAVAKMLEYIARQNSKVIPFRKKEAATA